MRPLLAIGAASLAAGLGELGVAVLVGSGPAVSPGLFLAVVPGSMLNVLLAIALYPLCRCRAPPPPAADGHHRPRVGDRLMFQDSTRRPPREGRPQSVQLALRVAMLGGIAVLLFAVLFFRLWVLQVLSAESYQTAAAASQARTVRVQAPRGRILDIDGNVLVGNRPGDRPDVRPDDRRERDQGLRRAAAGGAEAAARADRGRDEEAAEGAEGQEEGAQAGRDPGPLRAEAGREGVARLCAYQRHARHAGEALRHADRRVRGPHPRRHRPHAVRAGDADRRRRAAADLLREGERRAVPRRPHRQAHAARLPAPTTSRGTSATRRRSSGRSAR